MAKLMPSPKPNNNARLLFVGNYSSFSFVAFNYILARSNYGRLTNPNCIKVIFSKGTTNTKQIVKYSFDENYGTVIQVNTAENVIDTLVLGTLNSTENETADFNGLENESQLSFSTSCDQYFKKRIINF